MRTKILLISVYAWSIALLAFGREDALKVHELVLKSGDTVKVGWESSPVRIIVSSYEGRKSAIFSSGGNVLGVVSVENATLGVSQSRSDQKGNVWELVDTNDDGIPDYRVSKSGPDKGRYQRLTGWKWEEL
jgi:hypothetical protein